MDWDWEGAYHYDRSIVLRGKSMQQDRNELIQQSRDASAPPGGASGIAESISPMERKRSEGIEKALVRSDVLVAVITLL